MDLAIYGSGSVGCEVADIANLINNAQKKWESIFFIDDIRLTQSHYGLRVLKMADLEELISPFECIIATGEPHYRSQMHRRLCQHGYNLTTLIDPSARISPTASIAKGCIIFPGSFVSSNTTIGENSMIEIDSILGHDIIIGAHSVISSCSVIGGGCNIGERSFIGLNSSIKQGISVGHDTVIGMHSAVFNHISNNVIALGNPCRPVKQNESKLVF